MLFVLDSSLVKHIISKIRNKETNSRDFAFNIKRIAVLLADKSLEKFETKKVEIETPIAPCVGEELSRKITVIPVLRAGLPMADAIHELLDNSTIGHMGLYRDPETVKPVEYYMKMPDSIEGSDVIICDPLLATGNSIVKTIDLIKSKHSVNSITVLSVISAREGIDNVEKHHPDVRIYTSALDENMNDHSYIVPGAGDAGDRIFGTK
ncbi:uracil phosphoribosyltransferase [Mycoplasma haemofelis str. Langford 1]|uniref:Uracil phosphoribosyltransferase n=2 Tax=Mycoplasma haemofelis TaxID=29501 RepID=F6FHS1_MYCHI|nr:uracil phosphoribosyltransferase [Mycoplasma haemofelis]AEG73835.1 uracil phosphoribosyltransferase [Mycoplasma haemofelis Ohio2]CBY93542.1 uracil phosphoribosyltransferase [Mycoplasma haemofelis str. Langford 1]